MIVSALGAAFLKIKLAADRKDRASMSGRASASFPEKGSDPIHPVGPRHSQGKEEEGAKRNRMGIQRRWPGELVIPRQGTSTDDGPIRVHADPFVEVGGTVIEYHR